MRLPGKLEVMFNRKIKVIVLASIICAMSLAHAGCSEPFVLSSNEHQISDGQRHGNYVIFGWFVGLGSGPNGAENSLILQRRGIVTTVLGGDDEIISAAVQPDGKVVAVGAAFGAFGLVRYTSTGSLDTSFGTGGKVLTRFSDTSSKQAASSLVIQPDGKIVVAGMVLLDFSGGQQQFNHYNFGLARYNPDGSLDSTFGTNGLVVTDIAANKADVPVALALQSDGKIVAAGFNGAAVAPQIPSDFVLARYNSNGSLDPTFGTGGIVTTDINNDVDFASSLVIQPDGKLVAGGWTYTLSNHSYDFALVRYTPNGTLDSSFGSGGKAVVDMGNSLPNDPGGDLMTSMVLLPNGKILCAGTGEPNRNTALTDFVIGRFNPNGSLDTSFGTNGKVVTDFNGSYDFASSIALQPDGKFVVAGVANGMLKNNLTTSLNIFYDDYSIGSPTTSDFAVARYDPDGSLDLSFGSGGKGITEIFGYNSRDAATKVLVMPNGNILALGFADTVTDPFQSARYRNFASVMYFGNYLGQTKLNDFDGDGRSDVSVWRESSGVWYWLNSSNGAFGATPFGSPGDKIVPGDYDGDGKTDLAVWRPSNGTWYIQRSRDGFTAVQFGLSTDLPVLGDFDGDGRSDIAVWRPSNGTWYILNSGNGQFSATQFGLAGDRPVPGDYDGDGKRDIAVYRPSPGIWYRLPSTGGFDALQFGISTDKVVPGDFDGDGITDLAVYRDGPQAVWYLQQSTAGFAAAQFGTTGDIPTAGDFDSDGRSDLSVFRPSSGAWYSQRSTSGFSATQFGINSDKPVPSAYVPVQ